MSLPKQKLPVQIADLDRVQINDVDVGEAGEGEGLEQLAADASSPDHEDLGRLDGLLRGGGGSHGDGGAGGGEGLEGLVWVGKEFGEGDLGEREQEGFDEGRGEVREGKGRKRRGN